MHLVVAGPEHEEMLRELTRQMPMPGWIHLAYEREPNYFHGVDVQGHFNQVILALHHDQPVGMACRSIQRVYVHGEPTDLGYLHGLRVLPGARGLGTLARGYNFLNELHDDGLVPAYLTTVIEQNEKAKTLLSSGRLGLPRYEDRGQYVTYAMRLGRRVRRPVGVDVNRADDETKEELVAFLNRNGSHRQFFPVLTVADFGTDRLRCLLIGDFYVARIGKDIVGAVACWDQSAYKQNVVRGYAPALSLVRPAVNLLLKACGCVSLPAVGQAIRMLYASFVSIADDDPIVLSSLLGQLASEHRACDVLAIGFHEMDPLRPAIESFRCFKYESRLYLAHWEDGEDFVKSVDAERCPYLELATL